MPWKPARLLALAAALTLGACTTEAITEHDGEEHEECSDAQLQRVGDLLIIEGDPVAGAEVFADACGESYCHGPDGVSGPAPRLTEEIPEHDLVELGCVLLVGPGEMPSLATLGDQELADVLAYVEANF